jgi:GT2 family glycosyltransferase
VSAPAVVIPSWNGRDWLPACLDAIAAQTLAPSETIAVDNGSTDGSLELLAERGIRTIELGRNTGFAFAVNRGIEAAGADLVALVNTDVVLEPDWLERMVAVLEAHPEAASAACKMVALDDPGELWDAGDFLRRDGAAEQRGRGERDDGRYDEPSEAGAACAGAALYRRRPVLAVGAFDERFFAYLEDVDLGVRLRLAGWTCRYEPAAVARHAGAGSSGQLKRPLLGWVERNTLLLVWKYFPVRWAPFVLYRQLGWAWHELRERRLRAHVEGARSALPLLREMLRERRRLRRSARAPIEDAVPSRPITRRGGLVARRRGGRS